jgi:hypothetical protein
MVSLFLCSLSHFWAELLLFECWHFDFMSFLIHRISGSMELDRGNGWNRTWLSIGKLTGS